MGKPWKDVVDWLDKRIDGGSKEGEYNQVTQSRKYVQGDDLDEGYCKGVCIDWTRRVLLGSPAKAKINESKRPCQLTLRQGNVHLALDHNIENRNAMNVTRNELIDALEAVGSAKTITLAPQLVAKVGRFFKLAPNPSQTFGRANVDDWVERLQSRQANGAYDTEVGWTAFAEALDKSHNELRATGADESWGPLESGPRGATRRSFTQIRIVESAGRAVFGDKTINAALQNLLQKTAFRVNTVMVFGFGIQKTGEPINPQAGGHAVAAHRRSENEFAFFDPNYGTYRYESLAGLYTALMYLFGDRDPIYGQDGDRVNGYASYIIFARAQ